MRVEVRVSVQVGCPSWDEKYKRGMDEIGQSRVEVEGGCPSWDEKYKRGMDEIGQSRVEGGRAARKREREKDPLVS